MKIIRLFAFFFCLLFSTGCSLFEDEGNPWSDEDAEAFRNEQQFIRPIINWYPYENNPTAGVSLVKAGEWLVYELTIDRKWGVKQVTIMMWLNLEGYHNMFEKSYAIPKGEAVSIIDSLFIPSADDLPGLSDELREASRSYHLRKHFTFRKRDERNYGSHPLWIVE